VICADEATAIRFPVGPLACLFPCTSRGLAHQPSPDRTDTFRFSLPSGELFFRVPSVRPLRCTFVRRNYLLGSMSSPDFTPLLPICKTTTVLLASSTVFATARRLPQCGLRASFITQPSTGLLLVQGFIHFMQPSAFIRLVTPMSLSIRTLTCKQAATYEHLDFDVLFRKKPQSFGLVFSRSVGRSPPRFLLLPQVHLTPANTVTCLRALMSFLHQPLCSPPKRNASSH